VRGVDDQNGWLEVHEGESPGGRTLFLPTSVDGIRVMQVDESAVEEFAPSPDRKACIQRVQELRQEAANGTEETTGQAEEYVFTEDGVDHLNGKKQKELRAAILNAGLVLPVAGQKVSSAWIDVYQKIKGKGIEELSARRFIRRCEEP